MGEPTRKRSDGLATIEVVLEHARVEMAASGPAKFNLDRVLETSGIARSSVYHHFGSRAGLIATLELERWIDEQAKSLKNMRDFLLAATNIDEVLAAIEFSLRVDGNDKGRRRRLRRVSSLVRAESVPALAESLRTQQVRGTTFLADTLREMRDRGTISPRVDLLGLAYFIQSVLVGRVVVDSVVDESVDDVWVDTVMTTLRHLVSDGS